MQLDNVGSHLSQDTPNLTSFPADSANPTTTPSPTQSIGSEMSPAVGPTSLKKKVRFIPTHTDMSHVDRSSLLGRLHAVSSQWVDMQNIIHQRRHSQSSPPSSTSPLDNSCQQCGVELLSAEKSSHLCVPCQVLWKHKEDAQLELVDLYMQISSQHSRTPKRRAGLLVRPKVTNSTTPSNSPNSTSPFTRSTSSTK